MDNKFAVISEIIKKRRTVKPAKMNGKKIPDGEVKEILALGDWAPTHKMTEPWRFIVYSGDKAKQFCADHSELYKKHTPTEKFNRDKYEKFRDNGINTSHVVLAVMKRDPEARIPELEEIAATAAAIENVLLGATALGIASFWSTGGMTHHKVMKEYLHLRDEDIVMGIIYLGYTDSAHEGKRIIPLSEKITWK